MSDDVQHAEMTSQVEVSGVSDDLVCIGCGYNLRGLDRRGGCPECGTLIRDTFIARQGMTKRELAALTIKIIALWYFLKVTLEAMDIFRFSIRGLGVLSWWIGAFLVYTIALLFMWFKAEMLATWFVKNDGSVSISGRFLADQVMAFAIALIGLLYLLYGIIGAFWTVANLVTSNDGSAMSTNLINILLNLFIGWVLIYGKDRIASNVMWLRTAGTKPKDETA